MTTMQEIDKKAQDYAIAREALAGTKMAMEEELAALKRKYMPRIRKLVETGAVVMRYVKVEKLKRAWGGVTECRP